MCFLNSKEYKNGVRYTFETDQKENLGWRYQFVDTELLSINETIPYIMGTELLKRNDRLQEGKLWFKNYRGIWIFDCSFNHIKGEMAEPLNIQFIKQNGGMIHEE